MSDVQLISPPLIAYKADIFGVIPSPPIGLACIAGYLLHFGYSVNFLDCFGESPWQSAEYHDDFVRIGMSENEILHRVDPQAALIGISVHSGMVASFCIKLAREIKKRFNKPVVLGGPHVSVTYAELLQKGMDYVIAGEGEQPMLQLLQHIIAQEKTDEIPGVMTRLSAGARLLQEPVDMNTLPFPAWQVVPVENYWSLKMSHSPVSGRFLPMITSRGCPYSCSFCSTPNVSRRQWRCYSPARTLGEISFLQEQFKVQDIFIQDDNFNADPERVIRICDLIKKNISGVRFSLPSGVRLEKMNADVINALSAGGFRYLCLAPESGSEKVRRTMQKPLDEKKLYAIQRQCKKRKIRTGAFIIAGTPGETLYDLIKTAVMIAKLLWLGTDDVSIFIYSPVPGSTLAEKTGAAMPEDYLGVCWTPKWRSDYKRLSIIRKLFYLEYMLLKLIFQPFSIFRHLLNIRKQTFETKGEMGLARLMATMFDRQHKLPWNPTTKTP
jgi:anaerobic magnesium-protoporphyrin IX monomethyl ester cyclase